MSLYPCHYTDALHIIDIVSFRDDIKSSGKFAIRSSFKIGGREGVQWR